MAADIQDLREEFEYDSTQWEPIRKEAKIDMRNVSGQPFDEKDLKLREGRPTVAPEEMSQYRNQVINGLMMHPRGMKFSPVGNGANDKGAEFYQNKAREIEYRSNAKQAYILAADNALQRSYGFVRVNTRYGLRSANQEVWIEGFPNPDMVMPDADALQPDSSDQKRCWVFKWTPLAQFNRDHKTKAIAAASSVGGMFASVNRWVQGNKVLVAEAWRLTSRPRQLVLAQTAAPEAPNRRIAPTQVAPQFVQIFADELAKHPGVRVLHDLRTVDYPVVEMYLTNGIDIISGPHEWHGRYIPIVSCYGKVLYVEGEMGMERQMLSMTRFGRDPWKSYCYACSQQLEVLGMTPKAPLMIPRGSMNATELKAVQESMHSPKAYLTYDDGADGGGQRRQAPQRAEYVQAQYLQSLEMVKEGWRRAIQAAMGSNFLPTQAQRHNEKSGVALDSIERAATQGTYHFVNAYEDMIRQTGVVVEDLIDKIYDYQGDTGVMLPDLKASTIRINTPGHKDAIDTRGDYLLTVSSGPSSDSERQAADEFTDTIVGELAMVAQVAGPKAAAAVLAQAIRMRNLGPRGDQLADLIEPPEYKQQDGQEPPDPRTMAVMQENQQLKGVLRQAAQEKQAKVVEQQGKFSIAKMQEDAETDRQRLKLDVESHVKVYVAELGAKVDKLATLAEANALIVQHLHAAWEATKDRVHETNMARAGHQAAMAQADQAHGNAVDMATAQAALQPPADGAAA